MLADHSPEGVVEIESGRNPQASIIWLHGLGADAHDFVPLVAQLALPANLSIRFIFPHAPYLSVTINGGAVMRAWYDIYHLGLFAEEDESGIKASQKLVDNLINSEIGRGIAAHRIALAGFSQGGAVALYSALRFPERLAGVLALSTYMPLAKSLVAEASKKNQALPIFMAHGLQDNVIPILAANATRDLLAKAGYPVCWHEYTMPHSLCEPEIKDIRNWLIENFPVP